MGGNKVSNAVLAASSLAASFVQPYPVNTRAGDIAMVCLAVQSTSQLNNIILFAYTDTAEHTISPKPETDVWSLQQ